ncbi:MAG: hypothetical protein V1818_01745 [Candidatus Aenigmatarchaeota archaeon]
MAFAVRAKRENGKVRQEDIDWLESLRTEALERGLTTYHSNDPEACVTINRKINYPDIAKFLDLPDYLRKTVKPLLMLGRATADEVAEYTGRARGTESRCLNQLTVMDYLKSERERKLKGKTCFSIK